MTDWPDPLPYKTGEVPSEIEFGLHHVQLAMPRGGEDDGRRFYIGILGMTEVRKPPVLAARGGFWVRAGKLELHFGVEADFRAARKAHPGILVGDLDRLATRLVEQDIPVLWDEDFPGFRRFYAYDPWGNRLEFMSPLPE